MSTPLATHDYTSGELATAQEFVKRTRWELRELWMVRVYRDRYQIIDVNKDHFEIRGIGYSDADIVPLLRLVNAALLTADAILRTPANALAAALFGEATLYCDIQFATIQSSRISKMGRRDDNSELSRRDNISDMGGPRRSGSTLGGRRRKPINQSPDSRESTASGSP